MVSLFRKVLVGLVFVCVTAIMLIIVGDREKLLYLVLNCDVHFLFYALFCIVGTYILRFFKWHILLSMLQVTIANVDQIIYYVSSLLFGITPGKLGEVVKTYYLKIAYQVEYGQSVPIIFAERLCGLIGSLLLFVGAAGLSGKLGPYFIPVISLFFIIIIFFASIVCLPRLYKYIIGVLTRRWIFRAGFVFLNNVYSNLQKVAFKREFYVCIIISAVYWLEEGICFNFVLQAVGAKMTLYDTLFIFSLASIVGGLSMMPGSVGVIEASMVGLLVVNGVEIGLASLTVLFHRFLSLMLPVVIGGVVTIAYKKRLGV